MRLMSSRSSFSAQVQPERPMAEHPAGLASETEARDVAEAARETNLPIVAAGGIDSFVRAEEIRRITPGKWKDGIGQELHDKGVQLIQVHTALYFQGPKLIPEVKRAAFAA